VRVRCAALLLLLAALLAAPASGRGTVAFPVAPADPASPLAPVIATRTAPVGDTTVSATARARRDQRVTGDSGAPATIRGISRRLERIWGWFVRWLGHVVKWISLHVIGLLQGLLALALLAAVAVPIQQRARREQLILGDLMDASGIEELKSAVPGLSQQARQLLMSNIKGLRDLVEEDAADEPVPGGEDFLEAKHPLPVSAADATLSDLLTAFKDLPGSSGAIVRILALAWLPPRGTRITGTLQRRGDVPDRLGISFDLVDLANAFEPDAFTRWEPESAVKRAGAGSTGSSPLLPRRQAEPYFEAGGHLMRAHRYDDAVRLFRAAYRLDSTFHEARRALARATRRHDLKVSNTEQFQQGKSLEEFGLWEVAIGHYLKALPRRCADAAGAAWLAAFEGTVDDERATAWHRLAACYRALGLLPTQADRLYQLAAEQGSGDAALQRDRLRHQDATELTAAAEILLRLGDYDAAERFLEDALEFVAGEPAAYSLLVEVRQAKQQQEQDRAAQGHYLLGDLYRRAGAWQKARKEYEAALTEQPLHAAATQALDEALKDGKTAIDRYHALLRPATRQLAIALFDRELTQS
jgi:tetratricopeptide (TPR) repeat protein